MTTCNGDGMCLIREQINCEHNCKPIPCPNFFLCGTADPQCVLWCHHNLCYGCDLTFGTWQGGSGILQRLENIECPVCLDDDQVGVRLPKCEHVLCTKCFKKCFMIGWDDDRTDEPPFPYPSDIEKQYEDDQDNEKWENDELIKKYNTEWNRWDDERQAKVDELYEKLSKCPMCRIK